MLVWAAALGGDIGRPRRCCGSASGGVSAVRAQLLRAAAALVGLVLANGSESRGSKHRSLHGRPLAFIRALNIALGRRSHRDDFLFTVTVGRSDRARLGKGAW